MGVEQRPRVVVFVPEDFEHRKSSTLDWALQNVTENNDLLVIVVHVQTSPSSVKPEVKKRLRKYVRRYYGRTTTVNALVIKKDDNVVKGLRKMGTELEDITDLVVEDVDELYSEIAQSLNSQEMQTEAPPCNIRFIKCDRDGDRPIYTTRHLARSMGDFLITRILQMSMNNHRLSSPHKLICTSANADICSAFKLVHGFLVEQTTLLMEEYEKTMSKQSSIKEKLREMKLGNGSPNRSPSKYNGSPNRSPSKYNGSPIRQFKKLEATKKDCKYDLEEATKEKALRREMQDMETVIEILKQITTNGYFLEKPENDLQTTMALFAETMNTVLPKCIEIVKGAKKDYELRLKEIIRKKSNLESNRKNKQVEDHGKKNCDDALQTAVEQESYFMNRIEKRARLIEALKEIASNENCFLKEPEAAVTEAGVLGEEKNDQQSALTLPPETAVNTEFSKDDIQESNNSSEGNVYKALLYNTTFVAIKMLDDPAIVQGESDFIRKVAVLGRVRHPNLVTLIGVRRDVLGLVYEFLPNGSLRDHLVACKNGSMPPLKWQDYIKIIREIWIVLTFLHSSKPPLVHGNLKPSKVLLGPDFTCKLEASSIIFQSTAATEHHDLHSFGSIALQLLMTRLCSEEDAVKVVDEANQKGELDSVLKTTACDWPPELAKQLARVGLRCRGLLESPAEAPDDLAVAEEVRQLFDAADRFAAASLEQAEAQAPRQLTCPLSRELMNDPHIAADGHTYELEYIKTHFSKGNSTSPLTRKTLEHKELIPNLAIRSMMVDWKEEHGQQVRTLSVCGGDPNPAQSSLQLQGHPTVPPASQSQPLDTPPAPAHPRTPTRPPPSSWLRPPRRPRQSTGIRRLHNPDPVTSSLLTPPDTSAEAQLQLPQASNNSPPTTLILPRNTSAAAPARSHGLNPLPADPGAAAPPPTRPASPSTDFPPSPDGGIRRRRVNGRLPSDVPLPGETRRIQGRSKHE